uniref:Complement factor H like 4 n=1 Tax=Hucho hucho TaxID=62062 RepID=A0A4W5RIF7_9TELE
FNSQALDLSKDISSTPLSGCRGPLPSVPNARVTEESVKEEYNEDDIVLFSCSLGFVPAGRISYLCKKNKWGVFRQGKCKPKPCELPDETANGHYSIHVGDDFVFGATIKYTCNDGYQMVSKTDIRTCMVAGWSNHLPICEVVTCVPEATDERVVVSGLPDDGVIQYGHELRFSCTNPAHQLKGNLQVVCATGGMWNSRFPTCEGKHFTLSTTIYTFRCYIGEKSSWVHFITKPNDFCGPPPHLINGDTTGHTRERYRNGQSVQYVCQQYYILDTPSAFKTCRDGIWIGPMTCLKPCTVDEQLMNTQNIEFKHPPDNENKLYATHGDHITFKCTDHRRLSPGSVHFRQRCLNGVMNLPHCQ